MASKSEWNEFFLDAKIPKDVAPLYAENFYKNRMSFDMLADLTKDYLRDLDITVLGDIISILKHAKEVQSKQVEQDSDVFIAPEAQKVVADQKVSPAPAPLAQEVPKQTEQKNEVSTRVVLPKARRKFRTPILGKLDLMEELAQNFPHLVKEIFDSLDDQSLANCHAVNRSWANYLRSQPRFQFKIMRLVRRTEQGGLD